MNYLFKFLLTLVISLFIVSCSNEQVNNENFEDSFLKKIEKSDLENNVLIIKKTSNSDFSFTIKDGFESAFTHGETISYRVDLSIEPAKHECEGSGYAFAKCVKNALDSGKCLKTYKIGDTYYADVIPCN